MLLVHNHEPKFLEFHAFFNQRMRRQMPLKNRLQFARRSGDFAVAGAAVTVGLDPDGRVSASGIGLFGLGPTVLRAAAAETAVAGIAASDIDPAAVGRAAVTDLDAVPSDLHGTASYRKKVGAAMVARAWEQAVKEAASG